MAKLQQPTYIDIALPKPKEQLPFQKVEYTDSYLKSVNEKEPEKDIWGKAKDIASSALDSVQDYFGASDDYTKSKKQYESIFTDKNIIDFDYTDNNPTVKLFNKRLLEEKFVEEANKLIGGSGVDSDIAKEYKKGILFPRVLDQINPTEVDAVYGKDDTYFDRLIETLGRNVIFDDKTNESLSSLIDTFLEVETAAETLISTQNQKRRSLEDDDDEKNPLWRKTMGALLEGAGGEVLGGLLGLEPEVRRNLGNRLYNATGLNDRPLDYVTWKQTKEQIDKLSAMKIASMPEDTPEQKQAKIKASEEHQAAIADPKNAGDTYWESIAQEGANLLGSMVSPIGEFSIAMKGANAVVKGIKTPAKYLVHNKMAKVSNIFRERSKDIVDLTKIVQENPRLMAIGGLMAKGMNGKNLAYEGAIIPSIKSFMGRGVENAARMTIASGLVNSIDLGMDEEEAWEATKSMAMLSVGNEYISRMIGRVARGMKLYNGIASKYATNPKGLAKSVENWYYTSYTAGQALSQGIVNEVNGIDIFKKKENGDLEFNEVWLGEMVLNTIFSGKEMYENIRYAKNRKNIDRPDFENENLFKIEQATEDNIGTIRPDDKIFLESIKSKEGQMETKPFIARQTNTPASYITREAKSRNLDLTNLKLKDVYDMTQEQHKLQDPRTAEFVNRVIELAGDTPVKLQDIGESSKAMYKSTDDVIYFNENSKASGSGYEDVYRTMVEEGLHKISVNRFKNDKVFADKTNRFLEKAREATGYGTENFANDLDPVSEQLLAYHLDNPHEFLALLLNPRLKTAKEHIFSKLSSQDPTKGLRGILRRFISKDKAQEKEFDSLLNEMLYSTKAESVENNDIASVGEFETINSIETMPDDIKAPTEPLIDPDLDLLFNDDYGSVLTNKNVVKNDIDINSKIEEFNRVALEQGLNKPKTIDDFMNDAFVEYGGEFTKQELNDVIAKKTEQVSTFKANVAKIEETLNKLVLDENKVDDYEVVSDKINIKDIFKAHDANLVLNKYAGKSFDNIKTDVHKSLAKNYTDLSPKQVDLLSDFVSNQLSRTKEYKTLSLIDGRLVNNAAHSFNNKNLRYFDGETTGYNQWKEHFTNNISNQEYFMPDAKELINDIFSKDMNAIMFGYETVKNKGSEKAVSTYLEEILSDDVKYDKFIKENLSRGLYLVPRGTKNLSVISSKRLGEIASNPKTSLKVAQQLHKGNFYHFLDSDATWGYSADRPDFSPFAKMIKHQQLHSWAKGNTKKAVDLASRPEYIETLRENRELLEVLRNKAKEYYTDAEGRFLEIDHLFDENKSLIALDDEITSTFMWGLDPAGDGRTIKFSADRSEARVKKLATKYEGVEFGRNPSQLDKESLIRKHLPDYDYNTALTESDLKSIYNELGIKYHNGELYQRTVVIDPSMLEGTMSKIFDEDGTDGATILTNNKLGKLYNSMMYNSENSAVIKPKYYGLDNNGNSLIYKTGSFNLNFDAITEQSNSLVDAYRKNLSKSVGAITFNTSMKSGHTRKISRVPASTNPDGYVIVNAVKQPIGAEVNGKRDNDLFKAELELYKQNLNNGILEDKYILDIPLTGKNPLQLIGASHSADANDAGAWGIPDNPLHNRQFPLWQKDGGKAYDITQRLIGNVIDRNVSVMEGLISLRNDLGEALNRNAPDILKSQAKALRAMSDELIYSDNTEEAYDFVSNIGVDNFRSIVESAIDENNAVKKEYLLPLLAIDRFIAGQAGAAAGSSSVLFNASKRAFNNASKVRVSGTKATVIPDLQSNADMVRLINYEAEQTTNIDTKNKIKSRGMEYIVEMIDAETGLYKGLSQGVSLGQDVIKRLNLKMGDKVFAKLTPNDDLHSMVPLVVTGMSSTEGSIAFNKDYMTKVIGRDFDKDDLQIMDKGKDLSKEDFEYLWDFYTKEDMHTGILKDGNEELKKSSNILSNNQRLINEKFNYEKKAALPQEAGFGKSARQSHIGQGKGIGSRNILAKALKNVEWTKGEDGNSYYVNGENILKYPSDPKLANDLSELVQKSFDTYDYTPYDRDYELLKLFVERINLRIGKKEFKTYKFDEVPKSLKKEATKQAFFYLHKLSNSKISEFEKSKNLVSLTDKLEVKEGESTSTLLTNRILNSSIEVNNNAEVLRDKLIQDQATAIKFKANEYYNKYPEVYTPLNNIAGELISRTENFNNLISSSSPAKLAFAYKKMDTFGMNKKKTYLKAAQGVLFNDMANKYRHSPGSQLIARIGEKDVVYKHNGIEGSIEYNNQKVPLKDLFNEEGVLSIPELELDADLLNNRIALLIEGKGYTDSEKGNLLGRIAGVVTKNVLPILNKKGYDISEGEAVSILGFSEYSGTSFLLPSLKGSNAIPGGRTMEISNVEKGIRDTGLVPLIDGLAPQQYAFNHTFEYAKSLYTGKNEELGSPIIAYDRKAKKETKSIYKDIAKHLGVSEKNLNVNKISNQEWNGVVDKVLAPMLKKSVTKSKLFQDQATRDRFIENEMNVLSAGSIDNTLETLIARDNRAINSESYHPKDANGDYIISDSQKFVRKTMRSQYLVDYMDMISDLKNNPSKSGYVNYKLFNSNTKEVIINENALNRKVYNFDERLFPTNAYENGELVLETDELTGMKVPTKKYSVMGDLVDKKLASNQTHKMYSKHWVEQILPTKRQVLNTDLVKAYLSDMDKKVFNVVDNINSIDRLSSLRTKEYIPVLDKLLSQVQFNRKFDITHKDGKIVYTREAIEGMSKQSASGNIDDMVDIIQAIKEDFISDYISSDPSEITSDTFDREVAPQLNDYLKSKMIFKHTSDYLRNIRDNAQFISDNRVTDIASKKMLNQEVEKVNDMIDRLERGDFNDVRTLTRKFKISDEAVLTRLEDYFTRPREAAEEKYNSLLNDIRPSFQQSQGAAGNLKTTFQRALEQGRDISPEQALETMIINEVGMPVESIADRLTRTMPDADYVKLSTDMKELVRMANNDMGDWYNTFRKLGYEGYEKEWKQLDPNEKKEISDKTISAMKGVFNSYKNSLKTTAKVKALFGTQTPSLKTKEFTALEDLFAVTIKDSEHRDMFSYSMKNFEEKMEKIARTTSYAIQKAMNVEYLKDPETNKALEPIILGEFTSAMGGKFQYNTSYDTAMLGKLSSLTMNNQSVGIREGKPTFAMYVGRDGETKQLVGRFLNTYKKALYNADGSIKSQVPYITIVDDLSMNSRVYTMPISSISNLVTGEATYTSMRKHDLHQQGYYEKLSKTILPELKAMTDQFINDKGNIETSPMIDKAESNISREVSNLKENLKSNSIYSLMDKTSNVITKARVMSTYGFAGVVSKGIIGTGLSLVSPLSAGLYLGASVFDIGKKIVRGYYGNKYGTSAATTGIGFSEYTNPLSRGINIQWKSISQSLKSAGQTPDADIADASTKALDAARDNQSQFGYLVGNAKAKEAQKNPFKDYLYHKQTNANKQAMELIENHVRNKYAETEADIELIRAGDKLMDKIISKVEKNGSTVSIRGNNVFIDGMSAKEFEKFDYKLIDVAMDWSMLKGKFAAWEKDSYNNALVVGEANLNDFQEYFRKYEDNKTAPLDPNLVFNALLLHKVNSTGDYDKTPSQRSNMGKLFSLYSAFGKESFLNQTVYRAKREQRMKIAQEIYANDKDFQKWYEKKNGVPFLDLTMRSGKQDFIAQVLSQGLGAVAVALAVGITDLNDIFDTEIANELDYRKREGIDLVMHLFGVQQAIINATQLAVTGAISLFAEPSRNSKYGKPTIRKGQDLISNFAGGGVQSEMVETLWEIGALSAYGLYIEDEGSKYKKALGNTVEDAAIGKISEVSSYVPFVPKKIVEDVIKPKKRKR